MKTTTAKSAADVKKWIKQPHHAGAALGKNKSADPKPGEVEWLMLQGGTWPLDYRIYIPQAILRDCFFESTGEHGSRNIHMYVWDDKEEARVRQERLLESEERCLRNDMNKLHHDVFGKV